MVSWTDEVVPGEVSTGPVFAELEEVGPATEITVPGTTSVFDLFINGHTVAYAAQCLSIPYDEAQREIETELAKRAVERRLMPEREAALLDVVQVELMPAVRRGDTAAAREVRNLSESRRKIFGVDARPQADIDDDAVEISFSFGSANGEEKGRIQVARPVGRPATHDLRPAPDLLDCDRHEDGEDNGGSGVDQRGDLPR